MAVTLALLRTSNCDGSCTAISRKSRRGISLLELTVAMVVFGLALTGMFPLVAILSRDLLPLRSKSGDSSAAYYQYFTPARDWNGDDTTLASQRHTWYLVPSVDPWTRKLGVSAAITSDPSQFAGVTPTTIEPFTLVHDDDDDATDLDHDNIEDYTNGDQWTLGPSNLTALSYGGNCHRHVLLPTGSTPSNAVWTFTVAAAGWYSIQTTWPADQANDQTVVHYSVFLNNSPTPLYERSVDQHAVPAGVVDSNGRAWTALSRRPIYLNAHDVIQVTLGSIQVQEPSDETTRYAVADAVRLVQNVVKVRSLERSMGGVNGNSNGADVTVHTAILINLPQ
jgi:hypothetical protein